MGAAHLGGICDGLAQRSEVELGATTSEAIDGETKCRLSLDACLLLDQLLLGLELRLPLTLRHLGLESAHREERCGRRGLLLRFSDVLKHCLLLPPPLRLRMMLKIS